MDVSRRTLLAAAGAAATAGTAGCIGSPTGDGDGSPTPTETATAIPMDRELPENCPTSQHLGVAWPDEITDETVESFVEDYEHVYYRDVVVEYEPGSRLDEYRLSVSVSDGPVAVDGGYEVTLSGGGGVYTPTLRLLAATAEPPAGADVVPFADVEDNLLRAVLETAAEEGEDEAHVEDPGGRVDRFMDRVDSLSDDFEPLEDPGDSDTAYFDVDGTTVELTVQATNFHGDYGWSARYYVDEHVVWRNGGYSAGAPRDGDLLECREDP